MRYDSHGHAEPDNFKGNPVEYVNTCRKNGIDGFVMLEPLEKCLKAMKMFGDFIIPVAVIDMNKADADEIDKCITAGCKGIKFIRPYAPYSDKRYWHLYERLEKLGKTAVFHTGYIFRYKEHEDPPYNIEHMRASQIEVISRKFSDLKILMSHFSNPWWEEAWKVSLSSPNVYADLSGGTAIMRSIRMWAETFAPDGRIMEKSISKLCFGSDVYYLLENEFGFTPYIEFYEKIFDRIGLSPELREVVNSGNVLKLFG